MTEALVIDDNPATADALVRTPTMLRVPARAASGSSAAPADLAGSTPSLVLPDTTMPRDGGMAGIGFVRQKDRIAEVPVIVPTLADQRQTRACTVPRGADFVVVKPAIRDVLEEKLRMLVKFRPEREGASQARLGRPGAGRLSR